MKKIISIILVALMLFSVSSCKAKESEEESTTESTTAVITTQATRPTQPTETTDNNTTVKQTQTTTAKSQQVAQTTTEKPTSAEITYYSDNADNRYICAVADRFGSDKSNLIALIKTNASTDGATVLEFSGNRDESGKLITTIDELKYIYDVFDNGTIRRASRNASENISYNSITSKVAFAIAEEFLLPNLDTMREKRRYEDFF